MIILEGPQLQFKFRDVKPDASCQITFQRTLRVPDDNQEYPLPPGLGQFPLYHLEDYEKRMPEQWAARGGVFFPMYQAEAMWICFNSEYPCAIKIAAGKINAVSGKPWHNELSDDPQDYVVVPGQRWLDGFNIAKGLIRQFVAMPLGEGFTAEEQITGKAEFGGLQLCVYPMKRDFYDRWQKSLRRLDEEGSTFGPIMFCRSMRGPEMGFAPGGVMRQEIFADDHGIEAWDTTAMSRCYVHIVNSGQFVEITGHTPPNPPLTAKDYNNAGLPWFEYYDTDRTALKGAKSLAQLDSLAARMIKLGGKILGGNKPVEPKKIVVLKPKDRVSDGTW